MPIPQMKKLVKLIEAVEIGLWISRRVWKSCVHSGAFGEQSEKPIDDWDCSQMIQSRGDGAYTDPRGSLRMRSGANGVNVNGGYAKGDEDEGAKQPCRR